MFYCTVIITKGVSYKTDSVFFFDLKTIKNHLHLSVQVISLLIVFIHFTKYSSAFFIGCCFLELIAQIFKSLIFFCLRWFADRWSRRWGCVSGSCRIITAVAVCLTGSCVCFLIVGVCRCIFLIFFICIKLLVISRFLL